jgi:GPI inositol-deacylase
VSAVEFNEDLSAFHGTTLDVQRQYTLRAIDYILSLYPPGVSIIILGHSMGGVVGTALLPHPRISAIITMSSPHTLPPARFDSRIDRIYAKNEKVLTEDPTPILSLCGGATDLLVPSESCILPQTETNINITYPYRRTIFSSALEGSWTGVGHREMVWCHQVRWRIARAALELGAASSAGVRERILDTWLRDGHLLPPSFQPSEPLLGLEGVEILPKDLHLTVKNPTGSRTYIVPTPSNAPSVDCKFLLYVSQGSIPPSAPRNPLPLRASVYACTSETTCHPLGADVLKLVPNPRPGKSFPVPDEGSDESEGVVVYEADISLATVWGIAVRIENADGRGWVVGGFIQDKPTVEEVTSFCEYYGAPHLLASS